MFCCLSAQAPTVEFHETLLRAIFLFSTARDVREVQIVLPYLKKMAANYVQGLPEPERVLLNRNNPSLMRRIMGEASTQTIFDSTSTSNLIEAPTSSTPEEQTIIGRLNNGSG